MGKPTGFLEYERKNAKVEEPLSRIRHLGIPGNALKGRAEHTGSSLHGVRASRSASPE